MKLTNKPTARLGDAAQRPIIVLVILACSALGAGCATRYDQARTALIQGRYDAAAKGFEEILARDPKDLDALVGLGVSKYRLGALDNAIEVLTRAVRRAPTSETAHLYLGLSYLLKGEDGPAREYLAAFRDLKPDPRMAAHVERTIQLLGGEPLSGELRRFVAASLDEQAELVREIHEARREPTPRVDGAPTIIFVPVRRDR